MEILYLIIGLIIGFFGGFIIGRAGRREVEDERLTDMVDRMNRPRVSFRERLREKVDIERYKNRYL